MIDEIEATTTGGRGGGGAAASSYEKPAARAVDPDAKEERYGRVFSQKGKKQDL